MARGCGLLRGCVWPGVARGCGPLRLPVAACCPGGGWLPWRRLAAAPGWWAAAPGQPAVSSGVREGGAAGTSRGDLQLGDECLGKTKNKKKREWQEG